VKTPALTVARAESFQVPAIVAEVGPDGGLHRAAPGLAADRQAAYGRDPDAVFLAHRKRNSGDESGPRGQDAEVFAPGG